MYSKTFRTSIALLMGAGLVSLGGCKDSDPELPDIEPSGPTLTVTVPALSQAGDSGTLIEVFQFTSGVLNKKVATDGSADSEPIVFSKNADTRIYALSGYSIDAEAGVTEEDSFARTVVASPEGASSAPLFYSAVSTPADGANSLEMKLVRGVARVDINNADPDLRVNEVILNDAPSATYLFPVEGEAQDAGSVTYARAYADGITGQEKGVFMLFESNRTVSLTVKGATGGELTEINVEIPEVLRNKVYTVTLTKDNPDEPGPEPVYIKPVITVTDWEDGDDYNPGPDNTSGIRLDVASCSFPAGVTYDQATSTIIVPASGAENMRIAFRSDIRVDIDTIMLRGDHVEKDNLEGRACTVHGRTVTEVGNQILTTYTLNIIPQLICRPELMVDLGVRKASMVSAYDHVNILVKQHPKQIQTVFIGGREWMCFNAMGADLEDQIYPLEGVSVDEMYNEHFVDCVGMYFQYGKENPFSPWTSNNPNQFADQTRDIPWQTRERMPLPEGFHVSSADDWKALMPNGITLPAAWRTASGDSIHGSVVTLPGTIETPSAAVNAKKFLMRYVLFESVTTGAKLYVPFGGLKSNSTAEVPGYGGSRLETRTAYWLREDRYSWLIDYKATPEKTDGGVLKQDRWNYDGFLLVRGVKD